ncbi:DRC2 protein, partial [Syrrhaptes paradoxus]|nr:DRC2 protein [Syrrhaptes paradoxus]
MPAKRRPRAATPMSVEDELLLLQSRALAEEEAAKRKREMLSRFLKAKLAQEERGSGLALRRLRAQWRAVLRQAKAAELRRDVEILSQTFGRVMDCKDSVIQVSAGLGGAGAAPEPTRDPPQSPQSLVRDLEEAEEQHGRALGSHLQNLDRLLELQRCRLACLEESFDAQLEALKMEFEAERYGEGRGPAE